MLNLKKRTNNSVQIPAEQDAALFLNDDEKLVLKNQDGTTQDVIVSSELTPTRVPVVDANGNLSDYPDFKFTESGSTKVLQVGGPEDSSTGQISVLTANNLAANSKGVYLLESDIQLTDFNQSIFSEPTIETFVENWDGSTRTNTQDGRPLGSFSTSIRKNGSLLRNIVKYGASLVTGSPNSNANFEISAKNNAGATNILLSGNSEDLSIRLNNYGSGNREAADLSKTASDYTLDVATDGTIIERQLPKVYKANLTFTGSTNNPVVHEFENTFGGAVTWVRTDIGIYTATFPANSFLDSDKITKFQMTVFDGGVGSWRTLDGGRTNSSTYTIDVYDETITPQNLFSNFKCFFEIAVYP